MSDPIRNAVLQLVEKKSGISLVEGERYVSADEFASLIDKERATLPDGPRGPVFTHVGNQVSLLTRFFAMLAEGFRPVVLPAKIPDGQLRTLLTSFTSIPYDDKEKGFVDHEGNPRPTVEVEQEYTMVLPTSGSTGAPRLIVGKGENIERCVQAIAASQGLDSLSSTGAILPAHFSYCLVNQVMWSLLTGAKLVLTPGISLPAATLELLQRENAEFTCLVAQQLRVLKSLGCVEEEYAMPSMKVVNCAGGPFFFDSWDEAQVLFPNARFNNNYGCTEAFPRVSARQVFGGEEAISNVGKAIGDLDIWACDEDGRMFPPNKIGRIFCRGNTTGIGLLQSDGTVEPFSDDGSFPSGDYGMVTDDGTLHVYGRADQIINVGGERVSLIKIEQIVRSCEGIDDAVATGIREETGEQWPLVAINAPAQPDKEKLRAHLTEHLTRAAWPRKLYFLRDWPLLPNDKPDRKKIIRLAKDEELELVWDLS